LPIPAIPCRPITRVSPRRSSSRARSSASRPTKGTRRRWGTAVTMSAVSPRAPPRCKGGFRHARRPRPPACGAPSPGASKARPRARRRLRPIRTREGRGARRLRHFCAGRHEARLGRRVALRRPGPIVGDHGRLRLGDMGVGALCSPPRLVSAFQCGSPPRPTALTPYEMSIALSIEPVPFEVIEVREPSRVRVRLRGEFDLATVDLVADRLRRLRERGAAVLLDLDELSFIDAAGSA
jgi:hypothetical protein